VNRFGKRILLLSAGGRGGVEPRCPKKRRPFSRRKQLGGRRREDFLDQFGGSSTNYWEENRTTGQEVITHSAQETRRREKAPFCRIDSLNEENVPILSHEKPR